MSDHHGYAYGQGEDEEFELQEENYRRHPNSSDDDHFSSKRHKTESSSHAQEGNFKPNRSYPSRDQHYRHEGWGPRGRGYNNGNFPPNMNFGVPPMMGNMMGMMFNPGMGMYGMGQGFDYMPPPNFNHAPPPPFRNEGTVYIQGILINTL